MNFRNAYEGMKKLVAAEALQIISAGLAIIIALPGVAALTGAAAAAGGSGVGAVGALASGAGILIYTLAAVIGVISGIFTLFGLKKASEHENSFIKSSVFLAV